MDLINNSRIIQRPGEAYLDQEITVGGWVRSIRDSKTFGFIVVNDGTYFQPLTGRVSATSWTTLQRSLRLNVGAAIVVNGYTGSDSTGKAAI